VSAKQELPPYYSELAPFRSGFSQGTPILTYHHIAAPVRGARLKGLYLGPRLFDRQLRELGEASFCTGRLEDLVSPHEAPGERCFLTIDDGFEDVFTTAFPSSQSIVRLPLCFWSLTSSARPISGSSSKATSWRNSWTRPR
jgi:hypothetical protein